MIFALLLIYISLSSRDIFDYSHQKNSIATEFTPPLEDEIPFPLFNGVNQTGKISASFDCYGRFGLRSTPDYVGWPVASFEIPSGSNNEYLWMGGMMVGGIVGNDTLVSYSLTDMYASSYFNPPNQEPSVTSFNYPADFSLRAEFSDSNTNFIRPLGVSISNRSHAFYDTPFSKAIFYDMVITNIGDNKIEKGFIGFFFDVDIFHEGGANNIGYDDDLAGSLRDDGIFYVIDNDGDPSQGQFTVESPTQAFAFKFLESSFASKDTSFNWYTRDLFSLDEVGPHSKDTLAPDYVTPYSSVFAFSSAVDRYLMMSFPEWDYNQVYAATIDSTDPYWNYPDQTYAMSFSDGADIKIMISIGPFDLEPDSSARIAYTTFTGEFVHWDPYNYDRYINDDYIPDFYLENINFSDLQNIAYWADYMADSLHNPYFQPIGLKQLYLDRDSFIVEWDPWVYDEVIGYDLYLTEIPPELLPYPGLAPPWLEIDNPTFYKNVGLNHKYVFDTLLNDKVYMVNVAHQTKDSSGQISEPLIINIEHNFSAPYIAHDKVFAENGTAVVLKWQEQSIENIDHYNIYKFPDSISSQLLYNPFYDKGESKEFITPVDSFDIENQIYYYYAMTPFAKVDSGLYRFEDIDFVEGEIYIVSAVNKIGYESDFSIAVLALYVPEKTRDILVITSRGNISNNFVTYDSVTYFYDSLLGGITPAFDYEFYSITDSLTVNWLDFANYRMIIIDEGFDERQTLTISKPLRIESFEKYLLSGGRLAYFGALRGLTETMLFTDTGYITPVNSFINKYFAIDSIYNVGLTFFILNQPDFIDTLFGFVQAKSINQSFSDINFEISRYLFTESMKTFWPEETNPVVVSFAASNDADVIYEFGAIDPDKSIQHQQPVGLRSFKDDTETYLFGFHLWTMEPEQSRTLIDNLYWQVGSKKSAENKTDISMLVELVNYLYWEGDAQNYSTSFDLNEDRKISVIDLVLLIDQLF